jgi:hypothetical protein
MFWLKIWFNGDLGKCYFTLLDHVPTVPDIMTLIPKAVDFVGNVPDSTKWEFELNPVNNV